MKEYMTTTLEEYLSIQDKKSSALLAVPANALKNVKGTKDYKKRTELLNKALKKYLINARQAETNAKIVESLLS